MPRRATTPFRPCAGRAPGDLGLILYTSGTTGPSKGVCCPQAQYFWWAVNTASLLQIRPGDRLCTSLPLFHTNALNTFYQALLTGTSVRYEKRFSASGFYAALIESRATVTYLLGAMVPILLSPSALAGGKRAHRHALRWRLASQRNSTSRSSGARASACSTAGARPRPTSYSAPPSSTTSPA